MEPRISLCMIVRNEEAFLDRCLESVRGLVHEIIVADTGSTDFSKEIAARHKAKILDFPWQNDFSMARNFALDAASGEWILVLDADEEVPKESREAIRTAVSKSDTDGVELIVRSSMPETDILKFEDTRIVRLFRNRKEFRYVMPIHEQIRPSIEKNGGDISRSDIVVLHYGYSQGIVQGKGSRGQRNLPLLNEAVAARPKDPYLHYQIGATLMSQGRRDEAYAELKTVLSLKHADMGPAILDKLYMKLSQLALEKNENEEAIRYARKSIEYGAGNGISMYVVAIALLSLNRISEGYEQLLKIKEKKDTNLRLDLQLDHLLKACKELLKI